MRLSDDPATPETDPSRAGANSLMRHPHAVYATIPVLVREIPAAVRRNWKDAIVNLPKWAERGRRGWSNTGSVRPAFAETPGPGQESVWDYPRPPRIAEDRRLVEVKVGTILVARTTNAIRVLETAAPPTFYLPPTSIEPGLLESAAGESHCEWKGTAAYWDVVAAGKRLSAVAWSYPDPFSEFESLRDYVSFYPARIECFVGAERVSPQPGRFYGGWVTSDVVGPFKGGPGSEGW